MNFILKIRFTIMLSFVLFFYVFFITYSCLKGRLIDIEKISTS